VIGFNETNKLDVCFESITLLLAVKVLKIIAPFEFVVNELCTLEISNLIISIYGI